MITHEQIWTCKYCNRTTNVLGPCPCTATPRAKGKPQPTIPPTPKFVSTQNAALCFGLDPHRQDFKRKPLLTNPGMRGKYDLIEEIDDPDLFNPMRISQESRIWEEAHGSGYHNRTPHDPPIPKGSPNVKYLTPQAIWRNLRQQKQREAYIINYENALQHLRQHCEITIQNYPHVFLYHIKNCKKTFHLYCNNRLIAVHNGKTFQPTDFLTQSSKEWRTFDQFRTHNTENLEFYRQPWWG